MLIAGWLVLAAVTRVASAPVGEDPLTQDEGVPPATEPRAAVVLRGEVVEPSCFVVGNRRGESHRQCAIACARAGQDLAVLDERSGLLWLELPDRREGRAEQRLLPHIARRVEVSGFAAERGGVRGLMVESVHELH